MSPLVSFVIPCYNYGRYLRDCLDAIFNLRGGYSIEVIAVNDASPDNTIDILRSYDDPRLKIIDRRENKGHVFTVNEGLEASTGKYVCRIDPDDRHHENFLARTVPILDSFPEVGLVYGNVNLIDASGSVCVEKASRVHLGGDFKGNELISILKHNYICAPSVLARREAWMSAYPVPEGLAFNDWYFNVMLARKWEYYYVADVIADYRVHDSNWHTKVSKDGSEERSVVWLLDWLYKQQETNADLEVEKKKYKSAIYSAQYLDFANKYFGHGMYRDSRRCISKAIRYQPKLAFNAQLLRRFACTFLTPSMYEKAKQFLNRRASSPSGIASASGTSEK